MTAKKTPAAKSTTKKPVTPVIKEAAKAPASEATKEETKPNDGAPAGEQSTAPAVAPVVETATKTATPKAAIKARNQTFIVVTPVKRLSETGDEFEVIGAGEPLVLEEKDSEALLALGAIRVSD